MVIKYCDCALSLNCPGTYTVRSVGATGKRVYYIPSEVGEWELTSSC